MSYETLSSQIERDIEDSKWIKQEIKEAEALESAAFERGKAEGYAKACNDGVDAVHASGRKYFSTSMAIQLLRQLKSDYLAGGENGTNNS